MPFLENSDTVFMVGDDLDRVWRDLCQWKGDRHSDTRTAIHRFGTSCPAQGCHRCTNPDCPFADFIRRYWNHPQCD